MHEAPPHLCFPFHPFRPINLYSRPDKFIGIADKFIRDFKKSDSMERFTSEKIFFSSSSTSSSSSSSLLLLFVVVCYYLLFFVVFFSK